jgi:hypothetical protein
METIEYSVRHDLLSRENTFRLEDGVLSVLEDGDVISSYPLADVRRVCLKYAASRVRSPYYITRIFFRGGRMLEIVSSSFSRLGDFEDRGDRYAAFIRGLHSELVPYASGITFSGGLSLPLYVFYCVLLASSGMFLVWVLFFLAPDYVTEMIWVRVAMVVMLLFYGIIFMIKNKPVRYVPGSIPSVFLPC